MTLYNDESLDEPDFAAAAERDPLFEKTSDLLAEAHPGPTPFVVEDLLTWAGIASLVGSYKVGKTWALLEIAMSVAAGVPAFGRYEVTRGPVLLILEESGRAAYHRRMDKLARGRGIDRHKLAQLYFATNKGFDLSREEWKADLLAEADRIRPVLIAFDPLARIKGGGVDENTQLDMGPVLGFMRELREKSNSAVAFVAHEGHGEKGRMRGTSDLEAYWESKVTIRETEDGYEMAARHREAEDTDAFTYRIDFDEDAGTARFVLDEKGATKGAKKNAALDEAIIAWLRDHPGSTADEIRKGVRKNNGLTRSRLAFLEGERELVTGERERVGTGTAAKVYSVSPNAGSNPFRDSGNELERAPSEPNSFPSSRPLQDGNGNELGGRETLEDRLLDPERTEIDNDGNVILLDQSGRPSASIALPDPRDDAPARRADS